MTSRLPRRTFLKSTSVALALPALEAMTPSASANRADDVPRRMITICTTLGLHGPSLFPEQPGNDYQPTKYLEPLQEHRDRFTLFSGLSHPDQAGADGHSSQMTWLTAARNPGLGGFRNTISLDQYVREELGYVTRFPSMVLSTNGSSSQSYTRGGVMIPAESRPSVVFENLFLQGKPREIEQQRRLLNDGRSILDSLAEQTRHLRGQISSADGLRLDEYFDSIRQTENHFQQASQWLEKPKPTVAAEKPDDIKEDADLIGRMKLLMDLLPLIIETDSSRMISVVVHGRGDVPPVPGVTIDHHNLSHHGQDEAKLEQLARIETELMRTFGGLLDRMKSTKEKSGSLLDNTTILFGSNLGNANAHDWRNLPVILAGGRLNHGRYVAHDKDDNTPLCNMFVTMLQEMGLETDAFASSTGRLDWS